MAKIKGTQDVRGRQHANADAPAKPCKFCKSLVHKTSKCPSFPADTCRYCCKKTKPPHEVDLCPDIVCKTCKKKGHTERRCVLNQCQTCHAFHSGTCNVAMPAKGASKASSAWKNIADSQAKGLEQIQGEQDAQRELDEVDHKDYPPNSPAVTELLNEARPLPVNWVDRAHNLPVALQEELKSNPDAVMPTPEALAANLAASHAPLPADLVARLDQIPLYNLAWTGEETSISGRFRSEERPELKGIKAKAFLHFTQNDYSDKSLTSALSKRALWLTNEGYGDKKLTLELAEEATDIIVATFKSRRSLFSVLDILKLYIHDWWLKLIRTPGFWTALWAIETVTSGALAMHFGALKVALVSAGLSVGIWVVGWLWKRWSSRRSLIIEEKLERITDFCTQTTMVDVEIDDRAKVKIGSMDVCKECSYPVGLTISPECSWMPRGCCHNELNAMINRQLLPAISTPAIREVCWQVGKDVLLRDLPPIESKVNPDVDQLMESFLEKYPVGRRKQVRAAFMRTEYGYYPRECLTKAFVKKEWLTAKRLEKRNPRLVSGKTDEYLSEVGPEYYFWQKAMCAHYWPMGSDPASVMNQQYIYTGGMTGDQIGAIFTHFVANLGWHIIEGDYSRYDGHNEAEALKAEFDYYDGKVGPQVVEALRRQLKTDGRTGTAGHKFSCVGKVASGVINTSFGNTLRGFMILASYAGTYDVGKFAVMQLGDDNVIFVEDIVKFSLARLIRHCHHMGHKLEAIYRPDPDFAEYCSQRFWDVGGHYVLGPKPGRVLSKTFLCRDASLSLDDMPGYMRGIALGFKHYNWIPVLGTVCGKIISQGANVSARAKRALDNASHPYRVMMRSPIEVDGATVANQFVKLYGFDPCILEQSISEMNIKPGVSWYNEQLRQLACIDGGYDADASYEFLLHH